MLLRAAGFESKMLSYRNQTNAGIRRNLEELRRIQSDRYLQRHVGIRLPGVASLKFVLPGLKSPKKQVEIAPAPATVEPSVIGRSEAILHAQIQARSNSGTLKFRHAQIQDEERRQLAEFRKNNPDTAPEPASPAPVPITPKPAAPRDANCPCNSGQKYKRCCGYWSKSPLKEAA